MKNPCAKCKFCFSYSNRHYPSFKTESCINCAKLKSYKKYLKSKRKFVEGDVIISLEELLQQTWVMWSGNTRHIEVIKHLQLKSVLGLLEGGYLRKAERKEK